MKNIYSSQRTSGTKSVSILWRLMCRSQWRLWGWRSQWFSDVVNLSLKLNIWRGNARYAKLAYQMNKAAYPYRKTFSKLIIFVQPCYEIWLYIFMYIESGVGLGELMDFTWRTSQLGRCDTGPWYAHEWRRGVTGGGVHNDWVWVQVLPRRRAMKINRSISERLCWFKRQLHSENESYAMDLFVDRYKPSWTRNEIRQWISNLIDIHYGL